MNKLITTAVLAVAATVALAGCSGSGSSQDATQHDQQTTENQLQTYEAAQPIPHFDWSQYRQTMIDVETAEANGTATTTFMMNYGSNKPMTSCPSIGFPAPSTNQLTSPDQAQLHGSQYDGGNVVVAQAEATGVFTGNSSGTYIVCVNPNGARYITYWEGDVYTVGGAAHWDRQTNQIVMDGDPTVTATRKKH